MATNLGKLLVTLGIDTGDFDKGIKEASKSFMGLEKSTMVAAGAFAGAAVGAVALGKQLYELGGQGAVVQQTRDSFAGLVEKLNLAPDLLQQLRDASRGTVDDMTLMSATATLLAGTTDELGKELGNATPQLLEIAKAANKLNPTLGDTAFLYESIATGIKRASPMILDNLGLTIKIGEANEKFAQKLGKSTEALTAEEKQLALLNATMEAGDRLIAQAGGNVDSVADAFARNATAMQNMKDEWSAFIAGPMSQFAEASSSFLGGINAMTNAQNVMTQAVEDGMLTQMEHARLTVQLNDGYITTEEALRQVAIRYDYADRESQEWLATHDGLIAGISLEEGKLRFLNGALAETTTNTDGLTTAMSGAASMMGEATGMTDNLKASMQKFNEQLVFNKLAAVMSEEAALQLGIALGVIDTRTLILNDTIDDLTAKYDTNKDGIIDAREATKEYIEAILGLTGALNNVPASVKSDVHVTTYYKQVGTPSGFEKMPRIPGAHDPAIAFSSGGQFVVPPGYPNDTFPILLTSGEMVTILTPAQQMLSGVGRGVFGDIFPRSPRPDGMSPINRPGEIEGGYNPANQPGNYRVYPGPFSYFSPDVIPRPKDQFVDAIEDANIKRTDPNDLDRMFRDYIDNAVGATMPNAFRNWAGNLRPGSGFSYERIDVPGWQSGGDETWQEMRDRVHTPVVEVTATYANTNNQSVYVSNPATAAYVLQAARDDKYNTVRGAI